MTNGPELPEMAMPAAIECTRCRTMKPAAEFPRNWFWCRACTAEARVRRASKRSDAIRSVTFGIEIETIGLSRERCAYAVAEAVGGTARFVGGGTYDKWAVTMADGREWTVVRDGSLYNGGAEVVSPICRFEDMATVQAVVRALRGAGAKVDSTCGIHVHVGADQLGAPGCTRLVRLVAAHDATINAMLGVHAGRRSYCKALDAEVVRRIDARRPRDMDQLAAAWYGTPDNGEARTQHYHGSRYHGINLHSAFYRGTVEFRWFNGSLHAGKVRAYIMLALGLAAKAIAYKMISTRTVTGATKADAVRFLDNLNVKGAEFENCRKHLLAGFNGADDAQEAV